MKFIKTFIFLILSILNFHIKTSDLTTIPQNDVLANFNNADLEKEFERIASELEKNLTPEQKKDLEAIAGLPEEEQKKLFEETEKIVNSMSEEEKKKLLVEAFGKDSPLIKELFAAEEEIKPEVKPVEEKPETKPAVKEEKVVYTSKMDEAKKTLNNIISKIESLFQKLPGLPRVSTEVKTEEKWSKLRPMIRELESYLRVLAQKNNLLNILVSNEFSTLKNNLDQLNKDFTKKEKEFITPDIAGLKISYTEEEDEFSEEITQAQDIFKEIILMFEQFIEQKNVLKDVKGIFEKYAPKELKKIQEEIKETVSVTPNVPPAPTIFPARQFES